MTVSTIYAPIEYAGDASTVAFPVPWMFLETDDLRITKIDNATDAETAVVTFTTTGDGEPTGGTAILPAAIPGFTLRIERRTDRTQEMDLQPQGRFPAESLERSVDKLTLIVQELEADDGSGGGGTGTAIETIVTDDPTKVEITKTGTEVRINVLATNPTGPAGGDLAGTYPDPILKQGTGVGSLLIRIDTDFSWASWIDGTTQGGRGIAAGYAWFGDPGSQVHLPVWGANDSNGRIRWTRDYWVTTIEDTSFSSTVIGVAPPCMAYVEIGGIWCWVLTANAGGSWWYAQDIAANYNTNGTIKTSAWVAGTSATRVMADIAQSTFEDAACMVGNHSRIIRTTDWISWTDVHNTGGPVVGGIATDNAGTWIAIERDTGKPIRSVDGGLTWTNPTVQKRAGESGAYASATTLIPTGTVVHGNGTWLITGAASYAYSPDGIYWTVENSALGSFYGVGFDGVRYFATNPNNGADPAIIYQLLVSSIPFHRQVVAEKGIVIGGDAYIKDIPSAKVLGTDRFGKVIDNTSEVMEASAIFSEATPWGRKLPPFNNYIGDNWTVIPQGLGSTTWGCVKWLPINQIWLACDGGTGFTCMTSSDGLTWAISDAATTGGEGTRGVIELPSGRIITVGSAGAKIRISDNGGASWYTATTVPANYNGACIFRNSVGRLFSFQSTASSMSYCYSDDDGINWTAVTTTLYNFREGLIIPGTTILVVVTNADGQYTSVNDGATWRIDDNPPAQNNSGLIWMPLYNRVVAGCTSRSLSSEGDISVSDDLGASWVTRYTGGGRHISHGSMAYSEDCNRLIIGARTAYPILISDDGGDTFASRRIPFASGVNPSVVGYSPQQRRAVVLTNGGVMAYSDW